MARAQSFECSPDVILESEEAGSWDTAARSNDNRASTPKRGSLEIPVRTPRTASNNSEQGSAQRNSTGSSRSTGSGQPNRRRKSFKEDRYHWRREENPHEISYLLHKQASFSEVQSITCEVSQDQRLRRLEVLDALKTRVTTSSPEKRHRTGAERKDLLFSTTEFWEELRACWRTRTRQQVVHDKKSSRTQVRGREAQAHRTFRAPTNSQIQEERKRISQARDALPLLIREVKDFKCAGAKHLSVTAGFEKVTWLLQKIDCACETAFPTVYSTGRLLSLPCEAYNYYSSGSKTRMHGDGGWPNGVRSVALFEPELVAGSVEDNSTFVSRLEALRAWSAAARLSMPILARFRSEAVERRWEEADLGGVLHRTHVSKVMRTVVADLLPGLVAVVALYHSDPPLPLKIPIRGQWGRGGCEGVGVFFCSSAEWLNSSVLVV